MKLRTYLFGDVLDCAATCPSCGQALEFSLSIAALLEQHREGEDVMNASLAECDVTARLPTSLDVIEASRAKSPDEAKTMLFQLCVVSSSRNGVPVPVRELPIDVVNEVTRLMEENDPISAFTTALDCPHCARRWEAPFDIGGFLWNEIQNWAIALLRDVHALAVTYGWSEAEILSLSPARRRMYLEMVAG